MSNFIKYTAISIGVFLLMVFVALMNIYINKIKESHCTGTFVKNLNSEYSSCIMEKKVE